MRAKLGFYRKQIVILSVVAIATCLIVGDAVTRLILGSQGQIPESRSWSFVLLLYGVLSVAGCACAIASKQQKTSQLGKLAGTISAILSGALLGFFHVGTATHNNSTAALIGMVFGGVLMFVISSRVRWQIVKVAIVAAGSVSTYGAAFLFSATASAFLSTGQIFWGAFFSLISVLYFWFTCVSFSATIREIANPECTDFRRENITDAN
ncbi:MAG: hypothetical protein MUE44_01125 [Oscillatoriaceae cyanobacterium Prado104]|jgi:hypothetical protein|nr:hypothetical protein [Oscillatoriaceae cyanobacterium Prado104]